MENLSYENRIVNIVKQVTKKDIDNLDLQGDLKDQLRLDSIQIVELFAALEKEFDIELPLQLMTVKSAGDFMKILLQEIKKA